MKRIGALVIFDCDGVLVDSEPVVNGVLVEMLSELGLSVTLQEVFEQAAGRSMAYCCDLVAGMLGRPVPENFVSDFKARSVAALVSGLDAIPGIVHVLDALEAKRVPYCVASNGHHEKMRASLGATGLLSRFEGRMFSATEVPQGKPAPDVFLHAARRLDVAPADCCVVEDTPTGVTAGVAAGMSVYGYCTAMPRHRLIEAGAHAVFSDMLELPRLLFELGVPKSPGAE